MNNDMNQHPDDRDISLKGLIIRLWRGKWIIAAMAAVCVAVGALYVFALAGRYYESTSVLLVEPDSEIGFGAVVLGEQLKSDEQLAQAAGQISGVSSGTALGDMIEVSASNETRTIELTVRAEDPQAAVQISDDLAAAFAGYVSQQANARYAQLAQQYAQQAQTAGADADAFADDLAQYLQQNKHPDSVLAEAQALSDQLALLQTQLGEAGILIRENEALLAGLYRLAEDMGVDIEDKIETDVTPQEAEAAAAGISESGRVTKTLLTTEITNAKTTLLDAQAREAALEDALGEAETQTAQKWLEYSESSVQYQLILSDYQSATEAAYTGSQAAENALAQADKSFGQEHIEVLVRAEPGEYTGPSVRNTLVFAAAAGLLLGGAFVAMRGESTAVKKARAGRGQAK